MAQPPSLHDSVAFAGGSCPFAGQTLRDHIGATVTIGNHNAKKTLWQLLAEHPRTEAVATAAAAALKGDRGVREQSGHAYVVKGHNFFRNALGN